MNLYINLDLLYNINEFLFPLFYYEYKIFTRLYGMALEEFQGRYTNFHVIYSPMTLKSVCIDPQDVDKFFDFFTQKIKVDNMIRLFNIYIMTFSEKSLNWDDRILNRTEPFKLKKEYISFLKSKTRLNYKVIIVEV